MWVFWGAVQLCSELAVTGRTDQSLLPFCCIPGQSTSSISHCQVTTFSRLLTSADAACLEREVQGRAQRPQILFLQRFDTELSFLKRVR